MKTKRLVILWALVVLGVGAQAQESRTQQQVDDVVVFVDTDAEFPGGMQGLMRYLSDSITYPPQAVEAKIEGKVFVEFVIEKDGSVSNVAIRRGIGAGCDEEAIRVVQNMPKWTPAKVDKHPVRTKFTLPIVFMLPKSSEAH